jgi:hypothetical protein
MPVTPDMHDLLVAAVAAGSALLLAGLLWFALGRRRGGPRVVALLGRLATDASSIAIFLRGMFVPGNELFSREPEYPAGTSGELTVRKWSDIPEVYAAADVRAASDLLYLLASVNPEAAIQFRSIEKERGGWGEDSVAVGTHFRSVQILETCEPRLVAFRNPDAFRSLVSREVFEARGGNDFGLIYKGRHPATHRACWVVMGIGELGTETAARFLRTHATRLGAVVGSTHFAAIIAVDRARGPNGGVLHSLQPAPRWWRRILFRKTWQALSARPGATPG